MLCPPIEWTNDHNGGYLTEQPTGESADSKSGKWSVLSKEIYP